MCFFCGYEVISNRVIFKTHLHICDREQVFVFVNVIHLIWPLFVTVVWTKPNTKGNVHLLFAGLSKWCGIRLEKWNCSQFKYIPAEEANCFWLFFPISHPEKNKPKNEEMKLVWSVCWLPGRVGPKYINFVHNEMLIVVDCGLLLFIFLEE